MASRNFGKHVAVIGSGIMGSGIASVTAEAGFKVTLIDQNTAALNTAVSTIQANLKRAAKKTFASEPGAGDKHVTDTMARIHPSSNISDSLGAYLVIEAIVENLKVKHELFKSLDRISPKETIFATNTSSLSISEIGSVVNFKRRFGGLHFFNPVPVMKLLEVIKSEHTSAETFTSLIEYGKAIGKVTVECKDTPGFIVNRLLIPYMCEAVKMVERGDASVADVDTAMKLGAGYPMGPFELIDFGGLDTAKFIIEGWHKKFPEVESFKPSKLLEELVEDGKLGRKSGEGFHKYSKL